MTTAEYKIEKSKTYEGLFRLTEIISSPSGKFKGFDAYFDNKGLAICHARSMMGSKGDKITDETGVIETI